jgi:hypothetical protein
MQTCQNCHVPTERELCNACTWLRSLYVKPLRKHQLPGYEYPELVNRRWQMYHNFGLLEGEID